MLQHSTVVGGFIPVNNPTVDGVINDAFEDLAAKASTETKKVTGEDIRKLGYTAENARYVSGKLKAAGFPVVRKISGPLRGIGYVVNTDRKGLEHPKLRVLLGETLCSFDMGGEFAQRLVAKLEGAVANPVDGAIAISCFAEVVPRDGKNFVNHIAALKDSRSAEIKAVHDHFRAAQDEVADATARIRSQEGRAAERRAVKVEYFAKITRELEALLPIPESANESEDKPADTTPRSIQHAPAETRERLAALNARFKGSLPPRAGARA
jgi:hypothetical protein